MANQNNFKRTDPNTILLAGHLTEDPVIRTGNGGNFATFSVAANYGSANNSTAHFFNVQANANYAQALSWLKKGAGVIITGRVFYPAKQQGKAHRYLTVRADAILAGGGNFSEMMVAGNLTSDPELKQTQNGVAVTSFSVANNYAYRTSEGEWKEGTTSFIEVTAWRQTAEFIARNFKKGQGILIAGQLLTRSYTDKEGVKQTAYELTANRVSFAGKKGDGSNNAAAPAPAPAPAAAQPAPAAAPAAPQYDAGDYDGFGVIDDDEGDLPF